jgi:protein involved in polysaccharide export with SLBB domain
VSWVLAFSVAAHAAGLGDGNDETTGSGMLRLQSHQQNTQTMRLPGDKSFQRASDVEWHEKNAGDNPQLNEELEVAPQPFYERFSSYIRQTSGRRVVGSLPFSRVGLISAKLPDSYTVSSGDQIEIQVWGTVNANYNLLVDTSGRIFVPEIGSIQVQGVKNADLTATLTSQFKRVYKGFELRALVSAARSVDIFITGQAQTIGQRSIPSSVSVVGAALAYTRPAEGGSRRFIELRRAGRTQVIDLYCFSTGQCGSIPTALQDGDTLHVPQRSPLAAISGAVNRPGIFELAKGEGFKDLLAYAGGLSIDSSAGSVDLYSFQGGAEHSRSYRNVELQELCPLGSVAGQVCRPINDGDYLDLKAVPPTVKGSVTITAAGVEPLRFTFKPGMRLLDVVTQPLTRFLSNDMITSINRGDFRSINELDERLPEIDLESVTIYRLNAESRGYEAVTADASAALRDGPGSEHNVAIRDGDVIALDTKAAWKSPRAGMTTSVRVLGEVKRPGRYRYTGVRTMKDVVAQAGGSTESAATWSTVVLRNDDARASINRQSGISVLRSVFAHQARQEAMNAAGSAATVGSAITAPSVALPSATELGRLIGNRTVVYVDSADNATLALAPGDIVVIPPKQETIGCYGAVFRQGELALAAENIDADEGRRRCGIVDEMSPTVYQFSVRKGTICRDSWFGSCPPMMGGDFIVAVPDAIRKRGTAAFLEFLDGFYRTAVAFATVKILAQ